MKTFLFGILGLWKSWRQQAAICVFVAHRQTNRKDTGCLCSNEVHLLIVGWHGKWGTKSKVGSCFSTLLTNSILFVLLRHPHFTLLCQARGPEGILSHFANKPFCTLAAQAACKESRTLLKNYSKVITTCIIRHPFYTHICVSEVKNIIGPSHSCYYYKLPKC